MNGIKTIGKPRSKKKQCIALYCAGPDGECIEIHRKRPISRTQRRFTKIAPKAALGCRDSRERILEALERAL